MQELKKEAKEKLENLQEKYHLSDPGIIDEGEPDKKIVSFAVENNIDLIVMGARGFGFIKGMLIGSVTDAVLKSSHCPVFVVH
jgi:nucleotide-binding universal stress UspA family protein